MRPATAYAKRPSHPSRRAECIRVYPAFCRRIGVERDPEAITDMGQRFLVMQLRS